MGALCAGGRSFVVVVIRLEQNFSDVCCKKTLLSWAMLLEDIVCFGLDPLPKVITWIRASTRGYPMFGSGLLTENMPRLGWVFQHETCYV